MKDHGGDLDRAIATYGGTGWLDLSTGINPCPYPLPPMGPKVWGSLPTNTAIERLEQTAATTYGTQARVVALAGAQAAIQLVPRLTATGRAAVVTPTYNEHAGALEAQGWQVESVADLGAAEGADLAVVVNPNNPDGRTWSPKDLLALSNRVGLLVVDESFADPLPRLSVALHIDPQDQRLLVLRSFGKFYGLAGVRLGFGLAGNDLAQRLRALAGPWAVSGPALTAGQAALADAAWTSATVERLSADTARLDALASAQGWTLVGGTPLFRTYDAGDAAVAQDRLAKGRVWSRVFPYSQAWIRLGLPGSKADWEQLEAALA